MKAHGLTAIDDLALVQMDWQLSQEFTTAKIQLALGQLEQNSEIRRLRKERARVKTEVRRREIEEGLQRDTLFNRHAGAVDTSSVSTGSESTGSDGEGGFFANLRGRFSARSEE